MAATNQTAPRTDTGRTARFCCARRLGYCTLAMATSRKRSRSSARKPGIADGGRAGVGDADHPLVVATKARFGMIARLAPLSAPYDERTSAGEICNTFAVTAGGRRPGRGSRRGGRCSDGTARVFGYVTLIEAQLLAGRADRELGDQRAANQAAERALALAEADRLIFPFAMTARPTCSRRCLGMIPRTRRCSPTSSTSCTAHPWRPRSSPHRRRRRSSAQASCGCCATCRPTSPGPRSPASCPSR